MLDDIIEIVLEIVLEGAVAAVGSKKVPMPIRILLGTVILLLLLAVVGLIAWAGIRSGSVLLVVIAAVLLAFMGIMGVRKIKKFKKVQNEEDWLQ